MAQKPLDPSGGKAPRLSGRIHKQQDEWVQSIMPKLGIASQSDLVRRIVEIAQRHEEELVEAS